MSRRAGRQRPLLNLPFHYAIDDAMFFSFAWLKPSNERAAHHRTPTVSLTSGGRRSCSSTAQGGYLNICLHPFVSGRALRIDMLDRLIRRMKALPGVWLPTCEQVARHCLATHPRPLRELAMPWKERYTISRRAQHRRLRHALARRQALLLSHRRRSERRRAARTASPRPTSQRSTPYFGMGDGLDGRCAACWSAIGLQARPSPCRP